MGRLTLQQLRRLRLKKVISMKVYLRAVQLKKLSSRTTDPRPRFNLLHLSDRDCELMFRFTSDEILRIAKVMSIPKTIRLKNKTKFKGIEGLCITLRRLCYPNRLYDLVETFGRDPSSLSRISNYMISWIYENFAKSVQTLDQHWLTRDKWIEFAEACTARGSVYPNIVGFIDGTGRAICRPSVRQEEYYSGYYKEHLAKYQSIMLPNGIIGRLDGPFKGRRHDSAIVHLSGIIPEMQKLFTNHEDGTWYSLYGDAGYANQKFIKVGFKNVKVHSEVHKEFNSHMSKLRVSVEYGFGKIIQLFAFLDFKKNQKLLLQPIKQQYFVGALLTNMHTCLRGSPISQYFNCEPPTLEEYLTKMRH